jgi:putative ABC transport system permease protein
MKLFLLSIKIALDGINTHKLRSVLTMLGIVFGVAAVVSMLAIGQGAQEDILKKISLMGIDNIYIYDNKTVREEYLKKEGEYASKGLSLNDSSSILSVLKENIDFVSPVQDKNLSVMYKEYYKYRCI